MSNDRFTHLRRQFLNLGLTGAIAGTAGCTGILDVEEQSESETNNAGTPSADLDSASFTFEYDSEAQQVKIIFDRGAGITAGNLQIQHPSGKEVIWAELGSTIAGPDEEISSGATAVLGPNILNWETPITEEETVRLIYVGKETPATLERYSPPETTNSTTTVPASISSFRIESQSALQLQTSFNSSKQLDAITVSVFGPKSRTLVESDFTETKTEDGTYTYEASYNANSGGEFTATLDEAIDVNGNSNLNGQSITDSTTISSKDSTSPSISAFSIANPSDQQLRTSFNSSEQLDTIQVNIGGNKSATLSTTDFTEVSVVDETYTYEATYQANTDGKFTATLQQAVDSAENNGANNESVSISIDTDDVGATGPDTVSISRKNNNGNVYQIGRITNYPEKIQAGETVSATIEIETQIEKASDNIVYGALGTLSGEIYGIEKMDGLGSGKVTVSVTPSSDAAGNSLLWTWIPAISETEARKTYKKVADENNLDPDGPDQNLTIGIIQDS